MNHKKLINDIFNINSVINKKANNKPKRLEVSFAKKMIKDEKELRLKHSLEFANSRIKNLKAFIDQLRSSQVNECNDITELEEIKAHSKEIEESLDEAKKEIVRLHRQMSSNQVLRPKLDEANDEIRGLKAELRFLREDNKDLERDKINYIREVQGLRRDTNTANSETQNAQKEAMELKDKLPQCSVCLEDIFTLKEDDSRSILITQCGHLIFSKDLEEWTEIHEKVVCPAGCGSILQYTTKIHI